MLGLLELPSEKNKSCLNPKAIKIVVGEIKRTKTLLLPLFNVGVELGVIGVIGVVGVIDVVPPLCVYTYVCADIVFGR